MPAIYPAIEPHSRGMLDVGDGHRVYWESCGNQSGKPAVAFHGGPGSGCGPAWRRYFNPDVYRIVLFDQRGCGRSTPHASEPGVDLSVNTTTHLVNDIERLRRHLGIERWLVLGASWGSTLALAYAEAFPKRVSEMVLFSVGTTSREEVEWVTRGVGSLFPGAWERFREGAPAADRDGDLPGAYLRMLLDPDETVHTKAAAEWCAWEQALAGRPDPRYDDARFRLAFARLVTHYWHHAGFIKDGALIRDANRLARIRGVLIHGTADVSSRIEVAERVNRAWPGSALIRVEDAGHGAEPAIVAAVVEALDGFARQS